MSITSLPSGDFSRCWRSERARSARASILVSERIRMPAIARCTSSDRASGNRPRDLLQALRIGQALPRQRLEGAHLRAGGGHARDARRDGAQFADVGQRSVAQVDLGDRDILVAGTRQCLNGAFVGLGAAQARQHGRMRHVAGSRRARGQQLPRKARFAVLVGRADEIDLGLAQAAAGHAISDHAHELGLLLRGRQPAEACAPAPSCGSAPPLRRRRVRTRGSVRARGGRASIAPSAAATSGTSRCAGPIEAA